ncbi:MAG: dTDP-glucose 4,6-dehydratase [Spartobacteria bacterium]|nr:dTDP-glucose 4,6-dehydratase [Spartobacteria bacterium]
MKVLVTGCAGFIGSNFVRYMLDTYLDVDIVNLDALTYAGNLENLAECEGDERYTFIKGDISDLRDIQAVFGDHTFDAVLNFAAESHVDRSLHVGADQFIKTNILGTQYLLDASRAARVPRFLQVSTDEVYGSLGENGRFSESTPVAPNNPYSATKAGADFLVHAACHSHGLDAVITRCSNNYGPYQFPEKLIPLMLANALEDKALPVYGDGMQVRDWIYVLDHCRAIDLVLRKGKAGQVYNIGSMQDMPNLELIKLLLAYLKKPESLITFVQDRPGHDRRYAMDAGLLQTELGWSPSVTFEQGLRLTIDWYLGHREWLDHVRSGAYMAYYDTMYTGR